MLFLFNFCIAVVGSAAVVPACRVQETPAEPSAEKQDEPPAPVPSTSSAALDALLQRLLAEREQPAVVVPSETPPTPDAEDVDAVDPERFRALLTRASDSIQIVRPDGLRRDLQYWDKVYALESGDEVRQDGRGCSLLEFEDGAHLRFDGEAIWRMTSHALANPREIEIVSLKRYADLWFGRGGIDTVLYLPGGNDLAGNGTRLALLDRDRRALEIRVTGPNAVVVRCPYLGGRMLTVEPGQRIFLPVLAEPAAFVPDLVREATLFDEPRGQLRVQAPEPIKLETRDAQIELIGSGPIPGIARACGARVVLRPGQTMRITRAPLGAPRRQEWNE